MHRVKPIGDPDMPETDDVAMNGTKARIRVGLAILIVFSLMGWGQSDARQEWEKQLEKARGKEQVDLLNKLALQYIRQSPKKAIEYGERAVLASKKIRYQKGLASAYNALAKTLMTTGDSEGARHYADQALAISRQLKDKNLTADSLINAAWYQWHIGERDRAIKYSEEALSLYEASGNLMGMASALNGLGGNLYNLGSLHQSLEYHLRSLEIKRRLNDQWGISRSYNNIGLIQEALNQHERALQYFFSALALKEKLGDLLGNAQAYHNIATVYHNMRESDKAMAYLERALGLFQKLEYKMGIAMMLQEIGTLHLEKSEYPSALKNLARSLQINQEIHSIPNIGRNMYLTGLVLTKQRRYAEALPRLENALEIAQKVKNETLIRDSYRSLSDFYLATGDHRKALEHYMLFHDKSVEILNEKISQQISELQVRFDTLENLKKIIHLQSDIQAKQRVRNLFVAGFVLVTLILLVLYKKYLDFFAFWKRERHVGHYRLQSQIGCGGMSQIYRAHCIQNRNEKVAVKILREEYSRDDGISRRFRQEALIIDRLDHPNIVRVLERGEDKNRLFIVMEYLEGNTLARMIAEESPLGLGVVAHIMEQLAGALTHIHSLGIVHRDLKPSNVMVVSGNGDPHFVKLLDFGLARLDVRSTLTKTGELLGTIGYMSPEQLLDKDVGPASDIYSLGVIFYETACGRNAFQSQNEIQMIRRILDEAPPPPSSFRYDIPPDWSRMILRMMEKEPDRRPSLDDVRAWLGRWGANLPKPC